MTTLTEIPWWLRVCREHPRWREYTLTDEARLRLEILSFACNQDKGVFLDALEDLSGSYGLNVLKPPLKREWEAPPLLTDDSGQPLPNPWLSNNVADQRAITKSDPELAEHLRQMATNPYAYKLRLQAAERARVRWNKGEFDLRRRGPQEQPLRQRRPGGASEVHQRVRGKRHAGEEGNFSARSPPRLDSAFRAAGNAKPRSAIRDQP